VARHADAILAHCETAKRLAVAEFDLHDRDKVHVVPHANYIGSYDNRTERAAARAELGLHGSAVVILFLGQVRPYKGVLGLVDTFRRLPEADAHLVIAGKSLTQEDVALIRQRIGDAANITYEPGFVPDDRVQVYMNACDAVVLPYRDILTSGAAVLAMSFGKACIAPRLGCINDLLDEHGAVLYDADEADGLERALAESVARRSELAVMGRHNLAQIEPWSWDRMAQMTLDVYRHVCRARI
jgi:glycosyltransferase involved in cell wall biosynthesis